MTLIEALNYGSSSNSDGVVTSDSDELEGRFPAGNANLNTSSLYFDALNSAVFLGRELKRPEPELRQFAQQGPAIPRRKEITSCIFTVGSRRNHCVPIVTSLLGRPI